MKKLTLFFFILLSAGSLYAQIPKGTNQILIKNDKSAADNFIFVKKVLAKNGTDIASQDKEIMQIKTGEMHGKSGSTLYYVILCEDSVIQVSGNFKTGIIVNLGNISDTDSYEQIVSRGMKGSIYAKAFSTMDEFSKSLGENITYVNTKK